MGIPARRVLVVGGGAAGVITADHLLRAGHGVGGDGSPTVVTVVDKGPVLGPGLAYRTTDPHHLLNNYASRMSAREDDGDHLVRWCRRQGMPVTGDSFVSRAAYGRYLAELLDDPVPPGAALHRVQDEVVDLTDAGSTYLATTASGAVLTADAVVLALGNPPPLRRVPGGVEVDPDRYVADPWVPGLVDRVGEHARVLLVGTGLTTVDVAASITCGRPDVRITAVSRHGLLPLRHVPQPPCPAGAFDGDVHRLVDAVRTARRCLAAGSDWRDVVESLKLVANDAWGSWSLEEREQFTRHLARRWEVARHRMAPRMSAIIDGLLTDGRLVVADPASVDARSFDLVVNCTGPGPVSAPGWNPLVDSLAVKGMLWPGPLGLGVDLDGDGALVDADGVAARDVYAVGAARRGIEWEVAAVPDIRRQAARLAARLTTPTAVLRGAGA